MAKDTYHYGNLRPAVLEEAARMIADQGPEQLSLRELARRVGVSHAAPIHHFQDRRGLFTALAAQGFEILAARLGEAQPDFIAQAVAYVRFALDHPGHYAVMFDRSLLDPEDASLVAGQAASQAYLDAGVATLPPHVRGGDADVAALAAFSLVHGFATLWLNGGLAPRRAAQDPLALTRQIALLLYPPEPQEPAGVDAPGPAGTPPGA
jgi:AcrR family transcriptional regulator